MAELLRVCRWPRAVVWEASRRTLRGKGASEGERGIWQPRPQYRGCSLRPCFCCAERRDGKKVMVPTGAAPWAWPFPWPEELFGHQCSDGWTLRASGGAGCRGGAVPWARCWLAWGWWHRATRLASARGRTPLHFTSTFTSVGVCGPRWEGGRPELWQSGGDTVQCQTGIHLPN